jgi:hypothetical protein
MQCDSPKDNVDQLVDRLCALLIPCAIVLGAEEAFQGRYEGLKLRNKRATPE